MTRALRVAMVAACPFPYPRGTPARILRMSEALAARGHDVHVVAYHLGEVYDDRSIRIHRIPHVRGYRKVSPGPSYLKLALLDPLLAITLLRVLRETQFDLIHAHHYEGLLVSSIARRRTGHPLVYDAHTLLESELPTYGLALPGVLKRRLGRGLDRRLPRWPDHVISVTEKIRRKLIRDAGLAQHGVTVVTNGVERDFFLESEMDPKPGSGQAQRVVFAGSLTPYQGIDLLLQAFAKVAAVRDDVRLVVVSKESFSSHEPLAEALGLRDVIEVVESRLDCLPAHLASADVTVNPRLEADGLPQKVLNYMAAGRPTVSFRGSAVSLEHRRTGWIVNDGDTAAFADGILRLLADRELACSIGANAREYVAAHHTWEQTAEKTEEVYDLILGRPSL